MTAGEETFVLTLGYLAFAFVAIALGGFVKGTIGFGLPLTAMSIMATLMPVNEAAPLMVGPIIAANFFQALQGGQTTMLVGRFWPQILALIFGIVAGAILLSGADQALLLLFLAVTVMLGVILEFTPWSPTVTRARERPIGMLVALVSGFIGGMTTSYGILMTLYLTALRLPRETFVAVIGVLWSAGSLALIGSFWALGLLNFERGLASLGLIAAALLGMVIGGRLRQLINEVLFRRLIFLALVVLALNLVRRSLL